MGSRAILPDEYQLVLRTVERAHSGVGLVPDTNVLQLSVVGITCCEHFSHMAPIHADLVNRTVSRIPAKLGVYAGEEGRKLAFAHFARGHGELAMLNTA